MKSGPGGQVRLGYNPRIESRRAASAAALILSGPEPGNEDGEPDGLE